MLLPEHAQSHRTFDVLLEILAELASKTGQTSYDIIGEMDGYVDVGGPVPADMGERPHPPLMIGTRLRPLLLL